MTNVLFWRSCPCTDLELVLFPVDNHGRDLLIHEYQNGDQQGGQSRSEVHPPRIPSEGGNEPAPRGACGLQSMRRWEDDMNDWRKKHPFPHIKRLKHGYNLKEFLVSGSFHTRLSLKLLVDMLSRLGGPTMAALCWKPSVLSHHL